ncbi:MAG: hypothetical protein N2380_06645 [bacterium]|nr:hypothetical protein [bacterium]
MEKILIRNKFRELNRLEKDLQRIAIRRFFAIIDETKEVNSACRRGSVLNSILRMYQFEKEDLIRFIRIFEELKGINWVRKELYGNEEQA